MRSMRSISSTIGRTRSERAVKKAALGFRVFGFAFCLISFSANLKSLYKQSYNVDTCLCGQPSSMISRALFADVAQVTSGEPNRAGPLVEYERRIAAGELVDGDAFQVGTLRELQRLYDELVESANACCLDRYAASEKAGRSRWLWSHFMPQSSYSPVKGLYLYGGVGTGKTMLMDLFFEQLPFNWRKNRIHFHDFMLDVHSRLQVRSQCLTTGNKKQISGFF